MSLPEIVPREYKNLKYLKIPKERPIVEAKDRLTRIDEELEQVIIGLDMLLDMLNALNHGLVRLAERLPTSIASTTGTASTSATSTVIREEYAKYYQIQRITVSNIISQITNPPMEKIGGRNYRVDSVNQTKHTLGDYTDIVIITIFDDNVYIDFGTINKESTQLYPAGSVLVFRKPKRYKEIYFLAESNVARISITEWRFVPE